MIMNYNFENLSIKLSNFNYPIFFTYFEKKCHIMIEIICRINSIISIVRNKDKGNVKSNLIKFIL